MSGRETIVPQTHRGLWYEDGRFIRVLEPGRHQLPRRVPWRRRPRIHIEQVDMRELDFTIKGQEILTADKVSIRVSILVRFRVTDPVKAMHEVAGYQDRLYSDVQLAARRSLVSMTLEQILSNRNELSDDILADTRQPADAYGVAILRADVKDLIFPGNLQEVMNRVLSAERMSQAELVEARTRAECERLAAAARHEAQQRQAQLEAESRRLAAQVEAQGQRLKAETELAAMKAREEIAATIQANPILLRLHELETLRELATVAQARIYIGFDKHTPPTTETLPER